ncbi:tRNA-splicing endonuclease subunit Sen15 [Bombardia bombarda]|uniref:tRNA-splicing endonuclease subunit Sen15 n=1 Tax=Bombardia bombarda TaxID=252184 RepID=A0AA39XBW5_9PEZI|nr:tRNA-splicing endonuclease subunit Sen15 [Bombardia bombarda]
MSSDQQPLEALAQIVLNNLENQHDWTETKVHSQANLPRQLIYGLPPNRLYVHPDEQIEIIKAEKDLEKPILQVPEFEWVLPLHLAEKWSLAEFAAVFDAIDAVPPPAQDPASESGSAADVAGEQQQQQKLWKVPKRGKRLLLATVQNDSTVTYYWMHDGLVKPRQN